MKNKTYTTTTRLFLTSLVFMSSMPIWANGSVTKAGLTGETATLGLVSLGLLFLFYYVVREMGVEDSKTKPGVLEPSQDYSPSPQTTGHETPEILYPESDFQESEDWANNRIPFRVRDRIHSITNQTIRTSLSEKDFPFAVTEKLFSLYDSGEFREFLLERGSLIIECDTDSYTEMSDDAKIHLISLRPFFESESKTYHQPIYQKGQLIGCLSIKLNAPLTPSETKSTEIYCKGLAKKMEEATRYEVGRLDWETGLYNRSHFFKSLEEKFHQKTSLVLHTILISHASQLTGALTAMGSYLRDSFQPSPEVFRRDKQKISLFLPEGSEEILVEVLEHFQKELQAEGIAIAFASVSVKNRVEYTSSIDWVKRSEWELRRIMETEWIPS